MGPGITKTILLQLGYNNYYTLDIADDIKPDCVGSVLNIPFRNTSFDTVVCFQILEHIPYNLFLTALQELYRVTKCNLIISLPDASALYNQSFTIPKFGKFNFSVPRILYLPKKHIFDGEHYWEIYKAETPLKRIKQDITDTGFKIRKIYRVFEFPYHRFFVLHK